MRGRKGVNGGLNPGQIGAQKQEPDRAGTVGFVLLRALQIAVNFPGLRKDVFMHNRNHIH